MAGNMLNNPRPQFLDDNGDPFALGTLSFFDAAAHATPLDTHSDKELTVANANPVVLDAAGRPSSGGTEIAIFLKQQAYYVVLKDSLGNTIWDADDVSNILQVDLAGLATIATYAAARATVGATLTASERFFIETRTADGDDASGVFYWDATSTATDDDGTILKLADTATGRLLRDFSGAVSVKWFGATGDGVTDDTAAVAAAVATALNVLFPTGTYLVDNFASAGANQKFFGEGWQSIITHGAITGNLLDFTHAGITIRNLRLNGDGTFNQSAAVANNDRRALCKVTGDDFTSKDVLYNDGPQNCLHLDSMTGAKILKNKFIGGVATQTDTAYQGIRVTDCSDVTVDDNLFPGGANQYVIGIFFATFSSVNEDNTVTKNNVNGSFDNAIYLINAQGCTVTDNETTSDSSGVVVTGTSFV
ncbi:MAG: hypothetical protein KAI73_00815, partial [Rhodospirillaceae bacterium]|nr:hypothetical protein [Rhodospirillaceae bacterium]